MPNATTLFILSCDPRKRYSENKFLSIFRLKPQNRNINQQTCILVILRQQLIAIVSYNYLFTFFRIRQMFSILPFFQHYLLAAQEYEVFVKALKTDNRSIIDLMMETYGNEILYIYSSSFYLCYICCTLPRACVSLE